MAHNVPWTVAVEQEFRSRVRLTDLEDQVYTLHMLGSLTQAQMAVKLGVSTSVVHTTLKKVKEKYKRAMLESTTLPPFFNNKSELLAWQRRRLAEEGVYSTSDVARLIDEWVFDERARKILKRRLLDNIKYEQLAEEFDMSVRQIKSIVSYSEEKIYKHTKYE